ncbi:MAG: hypothetical protein VB959_09010 [Rhodospirillales bacterium]
MEANDLGLPPEEREIAAIRGEALRLVKLQLGSGASNEDVVKALNEKAAEFDARALKARKSKALDVASKAVEACRTRSKEKDWNASSWSFGIAPTWLSKKGSTENMEWTGFGLWTSLAYGFEGVEGFGGLADSSQIIFHLRHRSDEILPINAESDQFTETDTTVFAVQARFALPDMLTKRKGNAMSLLFDYSYTDENWDTGADESYYKYTLGLESKLTCNVYLNLSVGGTDGKEQSSDESFVLAGLKWNLSAGPEDAKGKNCDK